MTSFKTDIAPMFAPFRANMMWRFDITDYQTVKTNANLIWGQIGTSQMPPAPMPPFTQEQQDLFAAWMKEGFPP
jgi:uncharacterized membrane protein